MNPILALLARFMAMKQMQRPNVMRPVAQRPQFAPPPAALTAAKMGLGALGGPAMAIGSNPLIQKMMFGPGGVFPSLGFNRSSNDYSGGNNPVQGAYLNNPNLQQLSSVQRSMLGLPALPPQFTQTVTLGANPASLPGYSPSNTYAQNQALINSAPKTTWTGTPGDAPWDQIYSQYNSAKLNALQNRQKGYSLGV